MTDDDAATTFTNLPCTCGHTMADHQPIVTEDMPDDGCDLCDCASFTATPEPDDLCEMCGAPWHQDQAEQMDEYDLICPGVGGSWEDRQEYVYTRDQALLCRKRIEESPVAQRAYAERARSQVTIAELQANCTAVTSEVAPVIQARTMLDDDGLDVDTPHLTVKGQTPQRGHIPKVIPHSEDYSMYLGDDQ